MFESKEFVTSRIHTKDYTLSGLIHKPLGALAQHLNDPEACFLTLMRASVVDPETSNDNTDKNTHYFSTMAVAKTQIQWLASSVLEKNKAKQRQLPSRRFAAVFGEVCLVGQLRLRPDITLDQFLKHVQPAQQFQEMTDVSVYKCKLHEHIGGRFAEEALLEQYPAAVLNVARAAVICELESDALSAA
jgi:hypothetical protein